MRYPKIEKSLLLAVALGFLVGCLWLLTIRFILLQKQTVHFHANFSLYINGENDTFNNFTFYEEVQSCSGEELQNPKARVHMHENTNHIVHVHDNGVTWGHFFANLGYTLGDSVIKTDNGAFVTEVNGKKVSFILNGQPVQSVANRPIASADVLLINYGDEPSNELMTRFNLIKKDAEVYNSKTDPVTCSGSKPFTFKERLIQTLNIGK